ncbi:hypothetical protein DMUE_5319 [Dictyocoela muelleri]|nr:hypothetical protein DMUE_5319 [Dictyocoela muelleri]
MMRENHLEILNNLQDTSIADYLFEKRLIYDLVKCLYCGEDMRLIRFKKSKLGLNWRCVNKVCGHYKATISILHNIFFHYSAISPIKTLKIIYFLFKQTKQSNITSFVGVYQKNILRIKKR